MISFIVIGKNEEKNIEKCINSITNTTIINKIIDYEIIYIDSNSTDNSVQKVSKIKSVDIYQLTGDCNAAIGRNVGASISIGEYLFFIDGDMEINPTFINNVFDENLNLKYNFVSGQFENYYHDREGNLISTELYHKNVIFKDKYEVTTGGLFIVRRNYWILVNGMDSRFKRGQDLDFGLKLAKHKIYLLRKKELMAINHTKETRTPYDDWQDIIKGYQLYTRALLYRKHFFNPHMYSEMVKRDPSVIILIISILFCFIFRDIHIILLYFIMVTIFSILLCYKNWYHVISRIAYQITRDVMTILGIFFFHPSKRKNIKYFKYTGILDSTLVH